MIPFREEFTGNVQRPLLLLAAVTESPAASSILVKAGKLLDVHKGSYIESTAIWIEGERIKEVGPASEPQAHAPKNAETVDLSRATVLPGLIDCNTNLMARVADILPLWNVYPCD